jgi:hypothetical protein
LEFKSGKWNWPIKWRNTVGYMHTAALDQLATPNLRPWPSMRPNSQNGPTGLFGSHGPTRPSLAADRHMVADRGVRRNTLAGVVFPIAGRDEGGLNVERRMRGVRKRGPLTLSLDVDGRQRGGVEQ